MEWSYMYAVLAYSYYAFCCYSTILLARHTAINPLLYISMPEQTTYYQPALTKLDLVPFSATTIGLNSVSYFINISIDWILFNVVRGWHDLDNTNPSSDAVSLSIVTSWDKLINTSVVDLVTGRHTWRLALHRSDLDRPTLAMERARQAHFGYHKTTRCHHVRSTPFSPGVENLHRDVRSSLEVR